jgi:hypothetical protein
MPLSYMCERHRTSIILITGQSWLFIQTEFEKNYNAVYKNPIGNFKNGKELPSAHSIPKKKIK